MENNFWINRRADRLARLIQARVTEIVMAKLKTEIGAIRFMDLEESERQNPHSQAAE